MAKLNYKRDERKCQSVFGLKIVSQCLQGGNLDTRRDCNRDKVLCRTAAVVSGESTGIVVRKHISLVRYGLLKGLTHSQYYS